MYAPSGVTQDKTIGNTSADSGINYAKKSFVKWVTAGTRPWMTALSWTSSTPFWNLPNKTFLARNKLPRLPLKNVFCQVWCLLQSKSLPTWKPQLGPIEEHKLDTNTGKTTVLSCHRCLINTGIEKMDRI